ncbi:MAG: AraD1 family protein [Tepidisphaeraceae bacterium]
MVRLVQIQNSWERRVALVEEPTLRMLSGFRSTYELACLAIKSPVAAIIERRLTNEVLDYDSVYECRSEWRLLVPLDHPEKPGRCLVSGTGLTHIGSARDRQSMHGPPVGEMTDSMKMFQLGLEGGKPAEGKIGAAPEWFYKGDGSILRAHGEPLEIPAFAEDGGEEAEIAGLYIIAPDGRPHRVGMAIGNEFSDHVFEKKNYLNLAGSKLRTCSIGPELVIDPAFDSVAGESRIERGGMVIWSKPIRSGESEMCHSLRNIEHHHFKFDAHRRPGDVHVHYFGAHSLSFGDGIRGADGDLMVIRFDGFGRALKNPLVKDSSADTPVDVVAMK